jgi:nucleoside-diphosphate-sugar epimerase
MSRAGVGHIVAVSSMAVYDYVNLPSRSTVTEDTPTDAAMPGRDDYALAKMQQEMLIWQTAKSNNWRWTILRPGVIFGKGRLFSARLGVQAGRWIFRTGRSAFVPLTYVENCAQAIVRSVETPQASGQIINIIDDSPPTQRQYAAMLAARLSPRLRIVPIPWTALRFAAGAAQAVNESLLHGRAKIPGLLNPARLHARCKPLRYANDRAKWILDWKPRYTLTEALDRSLQGEPA